MGIGLFNLDNYKSLDKDDILSTNINESTEVHTESPDDEYSFDGPEFNEFFESDSGKKLVDSINKEENKDDNVDTKDYKKDVKEIKKFIQSKYKEYCTKCKNNKKKAISKKEFINKLADAVAIKESAGTDEFEEPDFSFLEESSGYGNEKVTHHEQNIPVPGGDSETPKSKPYDQSSVTIPGGDSESPKSKPHDAASIPIPNKVEISAEQYNKAISALTKSFKEGYEILQTLGNVDVVQKTAEIKQHEYAESVIDNALLEAYESGPIFETVKRSDKSDIKEIVKSLRENIKDALDDDKIEFYHPKVFVRFLRGKAWSTYLWQVVGCCYLETGNISSVAKSLNDKFNDELGEYKILPVRVLPTIVDLFKNKFDWKTNKKTYFLLIDKKIPSELRGSQESSNNDSSNSNNEESSTPKTESVNDEDSFDEFDEYLKESVLKEFEESGKGDDKKPDDKEVKRIVKEAKRNLSTSYKAYKASCKKSGITPMDKKEFVDSIG